MKRKKEKKEKRLSRNPKGKIEIYNTNQIHTKKSCSTNLKKLNDIFDILSTPINNPIMSVEWKRGTVSSMGERESKRKKNIKMKKVKGKRERERERERDPSQLRTLAFGVKSPGFPWKRRSVVVGHLLFVCLCVSEWKSLSFFLSHSFSCLFFFFPLSIFPFLCGYLSWNFSYWRMRRQHSSLTALWMDTTDVTLSSSVRHPSYSK